jgi:hypothetical protein
LSKVILFGKRSLRRALSEYVEHFHTERNHQGKGNVLLFPRGANIGRDRSVQCRERLSGLLRYVPKHAIWLNMVEIEIGVPRSQCLDRRIATQQQLKSEIAARERQRNASKARIKWMFTTEKARAKMGRAYLELAILPKPRPNGS